MHLNHVTLPCINLDTSVDFYRRLGLKLIVVNPPGYARLECESGATFSLELVSEKPGPLGVIVHFETDDLDANVQKLKEAGIAFESDPVDQPWLWREAYLKDPAGNALCLYSAGENRRNPPWRLPS